MDYQSHLNKHLSEYKRSILGISEAGLYRHRGLDLPYEHILPLDCRDSNLLPEATLLAQRFFEENPGKRHRYFHHLNSSQAFAFNLFFPYFSHGGAAGALLLQALGQQGEVTEWQLESVPLEQEGTNIDAWWKASTGVQTFCEVKLSEKSFGKARLDKEHLDKLRTVYAQKLRGHLMPAQLQPKVFFQDYQFYRNIWHMVGTAHSRLIFLLPRANTRLWKHLHELLPFVASETRTRISAVAIEDVLTRLSDYERCPVPLQGYELKLKRKYIIREEVFTLTHDYCISAAALHVAVIYLYRLFLHPSSIDDIALVRNR
jgi:hypothetical protein